MMRSFVAALLMMLVASPAHAASYIKVNFSAAISGGNANLKEPLLNPFVPNQIFTGSFVYDADQVPGAGTNVRNVAFPNVPAADAFTLNFGPYIFTGANDPAALIQYNNGQFNGFVYNTQFNFEGTDYLLKIEGGVLSVAAASNPFGTKYINGFVNIGNANLTGATPYTVPMPAVPEPSTWLMMVLGLGFVGGAIRAAKRRPQISPAYA